MPLRTVQLGPWAGIDNVHAYDHVVFQPPAPDKPPARLSAAYNIDLDDEGWPQARAGSLQVGPSFTNGQRLIEHGASGVIQVGDSLYYDGAKLATNLVGKIESVNHADQLYWSDGTKCGRIQSGISKNWGCAVCPTPQGPAGNLQVIAAFIDAWGVEHGASDGAMLNGEAVTIPYADPNAVAVRFYVAGENDDIKFWHSDVALTALPVNLSAATEKSAQCWTHGFSPPPPADVLISYNDYLVLGVDNCLYPSMGAATHLYDLTLETALPETIQAGVGLPGGMWVVTTNDAYWIEGPTPQQWTITPARTKCMFAKGSKRLSSERIPGLKLQSPTPLAVFMSEFGPAIGLPNGTMLLRFKNRYHVNVVNKRMNCEVNDGSFQQLFFSVSDL